MTSVRLNITIGLQTNYHDVREAEYYNRTAEDLDEG